MSESEVPAAFRQYSIGDHTIAVSLHEPAPDTAEVPEALVQDLWQYQRFDLEGLSTTRDESVRVLDPGQPNTDAGPDFLNAHIQIGEMDWRGHVEVHITSGDWFAHEHHTDPRYDSVILHVSLHADMWTGGLLRADESTLPEIVLYPRLETPLRKLLHAFHTREDNDALPCSSRWEDVPDRRRNLWIHTLAKERLAHKRDRLAARSDASLETLLYERLFAGLGYSKNTEPMTTLARRLPLNQVRSIQNPKNREALFLGMAGLLPDPGDLLETDRETADYAMDLRDRFRRLHVQIETPEMESTAWTFFRLRPNNFPPLRIAQGAAWFANGGLLADDPLSSLQEALKEDEPTPALREALRATPPPFWKTHYHLTKVAAEHNPSLGTSRRNALLVNAVLPVLLLDAENRGDSTLASAALEVYRALPSARNHIVRRFEDLGTSIDSAFVEQGVHHLYRSYCTEGRCLQCEIGAHLLDK